MDWTAVAAAISAVAVVVSLVIFTVESRRRAAEARKAATHDAISRVLQTMESAVRWQQKPVFIRMFANPELDYALAVLRLRHELPNEESPVAQWTLSQAQLMMAATSDRGSRDIGVQVASKLVEWGQGAVPDEWFLTELGLHPPQAQFKVPRERRRRRSLSRAKESFIEGTAIALVVMLFHGLKALWKSVR